MNFERYIESSKASTLVVEMYNAIQKYITQCAIDKRWIDSEIYTEITTYMSMLSEYCPEVSVNMMYPDQSILNIDLENLPEHEFSRVINRGLFVLSEISPTVELKAQALNIIEFFGAFAETKGV